MLLSKVARMYVPEKFATLQACKISRYLQCCNVTLAVARTRRFSF